MQHRTIAFLQPLFVCLPSSKVTHNFPVNYKVLKGVTSLVVPLAHQVIYLLSKFFVCKCAVEQAFQNLALTDDNLSDFSRSSWLYFGFAQRDG